MMQARMPHRTGRMQLQPHTARPVHSQLQLGSAQLKCPAQLPGEAHLRLLREPAAPRRQRQRLCVDAAQPALPLAQQAPGCRRLVGGWEWVGSECPSDCQANLTYPLGGGQEGERSPSCRGTARPAPVCAAALQVNLTGCNTTNPHLLGTWGATRPAGGAPAACCCPTSPAPRTPATAPPAAGRGGTGSGGQTRALHT